MAVCVPLASSDIVVLISSLMLPNFSGLELINDKKWAWKNVALKTKVQHTLYKGTHK
jgi:hypothetical protein